METEGGFSIIIDGATGDINNHLATGGADVTKIYSRQGNIISLKGLESFVNLEVLDLSGNLHFFKPEEVAKTLQGLKGLKHLWIPMKSTKDEDIVVLEMPQLCSINGLKVSQSSSLPPPAPKLRATPANVIRNPEPPESPLLSTTDFAAAADSVFDKLASSFIEPDLPERTRPNKPDVDVSGDVEREGSYRIEVNRFNNAKPSHKSSFSVDNYDGISRAVELQLKLGKALGKDTESSFVEELLKEQAQGVSRARGGDSDAEGLLRVFDSLRDTLGKQQPALAEPLKELRDAIGSQFRTPKPHDDASGAHQYATPASLIGQRSGESQGPQRDLSLSLDLQEVENDTPGIPFATEQIGFLRAENAQLREQLRHVKEFKEIETERPSEKSGRERTEMERDKFGLSRQRQQKQISQNIQGRKYLSLQGLEELIYEIFQSKAKADEASRREGRARETMGQHFYTFLNRRYGVPGLVFEWADSIVRAITRFEPKNFLVALFAEVLRDCVEEEYYWTGERMRNSLLSLVKVYFRGKYYSLPRAQQDKIVAEKTRGLLEEQEWIDLIAHIFEERDAAEVADAVHAENDQDIAEERAKNLVVPVRSESKALVDKYQEGKRLTWEEDRAIKREMTLRCRAVRFTTFANTILRWHLDSHRRQIAPITSAFAIADRKGEGFLRGDSFDVFLSRLAPDLPESTRRLLRQEADPANTGCVTYSDCVRCVLLVAEGAQGDVASQSRQTTNGTKRKDTTSNITATTTTTTMVMSATNANVSEQRSKRGRECGSTVPESSSSSGSFGDTIEVDLSRELGGSRSQSQHQKQQQQQE